MSDETRDRPASADDVQVHGLAIELVATTPPSIVVTHLEATVPAAAFQRLVAAAAAQTGINATGTLGQGHFGIAVRVSLLRLTVTFEPIVTDGRLILQPRGGVPGWLIGFAAPLVARTSGVTMSSDGRVTVDLAALVPSGVEIRHGLSSFVVSPEQILLSFD